MTPKEKAEELVNKFEYELIEQAKKYSLIIVDEILESHSFVMNGIKPSIYNYYQLRSL